MSYRDIIYNQEARQKMMAGVDTLANSVKVTLGPRGRNVVLQQHIGSPIITKDGVSVAREVFLADPFENMGAQMLKEVASKANDEAGDGTTTATVLAQAILKEGMKHISAGVNPSEIKRGIDYATEQVLNTLESNSIPCKELEDLINVATISANGDREVGKLVAEAVQRVGETGVVTVESSNGLEDVLETVEGMKFDRGYLSPYFITNADKGVAELNEPYILLTDKFITSIQDLIPILEAVVKSGKPLLIIAEDVNGDVLSNLVMNTLRGAIRVVAVKSPGYGERKKAMLQDIATVTGASIASKDIGLDLDKLNLTHLGKARKVIITKDDTTIVDGEGSKEAIESRIKQIKDQAEALTSPYEKELTLERAARMVGGVAVIKVGAVTELEMKEKVDRVEDALRATQSAYQKGIVAGGGVSLVNASEHIKTSTDFSNEFLLGVNIIRDAVKAPFRQILINADKEPSVILDKILSSEDPNYGYNAHAETYGDMIEMGVIDPVKVTMSALKYASSIAGLMLTTDCMFAIVPDHNDKGSGQFPGV